MFLGERKIRPSVIVRMVTAGFRSEWGGETFAAFRSVECTAPVYRAPALDAVKLVLPATRRRMIQPPR